MAAAHIGAMQSLSRSAGKWPPSDAAVLGSTHSSASSQWPVGDNVLKTSRLGKPTVTGSRLLHDVSENLILRPRTATSRREASSMSSPDLIYVAQVPLDVPPGLATFGLAVASSVMPDVFCHWMVLVERQGSQEVREGMEMGRDGEKVCFTSQFSSAWRQPGSLPAGGDIT